VRNYNRDVMLAWRANHDVQFINNAYACAVYLCSYVFKAETAMSQCLRDVAKEASDQTVKAQLRKLGNTFLHRREVSAQEVAYRVLGLNLRNNSHGTLFVNSDLPEDRVRILKSQAELQRCAEQGSDQIFYNGLHERYAARPDSLEVMCYTEFAASYVPKYQPRQRTDGKDDEEPADDATLEGDVSHQHKAEVITLKDGLGKMSKRRQNAILRFYSVKREKQPEKYFYSRLCLYYPWRNEGVDFVRFGTYEDFYNGDGVQQVVVDKSRGLPWKVKTCSMILLTFSNMDHPSSLGISWLQRQKLQDYKK
jgi:hypothetical protein